MSSPASELRCGQCTKLLASGTFTGWVEVKCLRCKMVNTFESKAGRANHFGSVK